MRFSLSFLALAAVALLSSAGMSSSAAEPGLQLAKAVPLGGPDKWDYLTYDQNAHRLYVVHGSEVTVLDGQTDEVVGHVTGLTGAHGVALVPDVDRGYVTNNGHVSVFNLRTLTVVQDIATDAGADAIAYDPASRRVFSINGKAENASVIDPTNGTILTTIPLDGKPEFVTVDGRGKLFVNIESTREIVRINTTTMQVDARWSIADCLDPHGLSIDAASRRLFASCVNAKMVVVDAENGQVIATLPIGIGSDAVVFDPVRMQALSSNGEGSLSIIGEQDESHFVAQETVVTAPGARTMATDYSDGQVFLITADPDPETQAAGQRRRFIPGTVKLLIFERQQKP